MDERQLLRRVWLEREVERAREELADANKQADKAQHRAVRAEESEKRIREVLYSQTRPLDFDPAWRMLSDKAWAGELAAFLLIPQTEAGEDDELESDGYIIQLRVLSADYAFRYTSAIRWQPARLPRVFA